MSDPSAKIIADSISPDGVRVTTFEARFWRPVLAEFNTHRVFSRNSASSRAIPLSKQLQRIVDHLAYPAVFPLEQKGMQGGESLHGVELLEAVDLWTGAANEASEYARNLGDLKVHKSVANRLLEPFMMHTAVVTSTAYENFFNQRCSPDAQPEIRIVAEMMSDAYEDSEPQPLREGLWHLPYVTFGEDDYAMATLLGAQEEDTPDNVRRGLVKVSAARCARTSYLTQDGKRAVDEDLTLYTRLRERKDPHWSPLEHPCTPWPQNRQNDYTHGLSFNGLDGVNRFVETNHLPRVGNLLAWRQLRIEEETKMGAVTFR